MHSKLQFGISTTVLREHPVSCALEEIARVGYQSAEVWLWHLKQCDEEPASLAHQARDLGITLTMHAPAGIFNPISIDLELAQEAQRQIAESLEIAVELQTGAVAVHPGRLHSIEDPLDEAWERTLEWITEMDELAFRLGLRVGLDLMEKLPLEKFTLPKHATQLIENPLKQIGLTVDVAQMNTHMDPVKFLCQLEPEWITHAHLSDNAPDQIHLQLGEGQIDLGAFFSSPIEGMLFKSHRG